MEYIKNQKSAIPVVLLAGLLWSFGPLVVRYMDQPNLFPWQYIFTRGITIFLILNVFLFFGYDNFHMVNYQHYSRCYFALFSSYASYNSFTRFFILKRKNINKCLDCNNNCSYRNNTNGIWRYKQKFFNGIIIWIAVSVGIFCFFCFFKMEKRNAKVYNSSSLRSILCICVSNNYY